MPETIRVRIAVAIGPDGKWKAEGGSQYAEGVCMEDAVNYLGYPCISRIVEVDLPTFETPKPIRGEVAR